MVNALPKITGTLYGSVELFSSNTLNIVQTIVTSCIFCDKDSSGFTNCLLNSKNMDGILTVILLRVFS